MVTTLLIDGMRSAHCARAVYTALAGVPGISTADVVMGRARLQHDSLLDEGAIQAAIALLGYTLRSLHTDRRQLPLQQPSEEARDHSGG